MTVTINAKGTSAPSFKIGKRGTTLHQGTAIDPSTVPQGDFWFDSLMGSLRYKGTDPASWRNLVFDDISFINNSIISVTSDSTISLNGDITLTPAAGGDVKIGVNGTPVISTEPGQSLSIAPDLHLYLNGMQFPDTDGTSGQAIVTDGAGHLTFESVASAVPALTESQIAFGDANNGVTSSPALTFNDTDGMLTVGTAGTGIIISDTGASLSIIGDAGLSLNTNTGIVSIDTGHGANVIESSVGDSLTITGDTGLSLTTATGRVSIATGTASYAMPATDGTVGQVIVTNGAGSLSWTTPALLTSFDRREITNPASIKGALVLNKKLKPISFTGIRSSVKKLGFISDEVQAVIPFAVSVVDGLQAVDTTVFFAHLVACVQELTEKLSKAEAKIAKLEKKNP